MTIIETDGATRPTPTATTLQADTLRLLFTYGIATIVIVGGGALLVLTRGDPSSKDLAVIAAGFIGSALTFVFGQESSTRAARQSSAAVIAARTDAASQQPLP